ncbi:MAG: hypothetical protein ACOVQ4_20235 [Flectobacillus sp.]|uniref:hypothetical protein n=1 Tax=Flectobacillus sp. TaxID=50419 RepID=UPI003B9A3049
MQKNIKLLIPVDFTNTTLETIEWAMSVFDENPVEIVLLLAREMEYSITEMILYKPKYFLNEVLTTDFNASIHELRQTYPNTLAKIHIEVFHGNTVQAMKNFLEIHTINCICLPPEGLYKPLKDSFDPRKLLLKSTISVIEMPLYVSVAV